MDAASTIRQKKRRTWPSDIATLPAGQLAPVLHESPKRHFGQPASPCNLSGVTGPDCVELVRGQDPPMKAVRSERSGVPDDTPHLALRVDEQLGAGAEATPLVCGSRCRLAALPGTQFTGEPRDVLGVVLGHWTVTRYNRTVCGGSGWGPLTHRRAPRRTSRDETRHQSRAATDEANETCDIAARAWCANQQGRASRTHVPKTGTLPPTTGSSGRLPPS
jgi:hypothetical protein